MRTLCSSSKAALQSNTALVASSIKIMGAHSHRLCGSTSGRHFLIVVDAYSKYPEVISAPNITSRQTVIILRKLCAQHGVPETIVSDNGTQFTSHEFREFCKANAVSHILLPPYHPQSNGRAERFVDTFFSFGSCC